MADFTPPTDERGFVINIAQRDACDHKPAIPLQFNGLGRDQVTPRTLVIYLDRKATDDELRHLDDLLRREFDK